MNGNNAYQPPYSVTPAIVNLVSEISEAVGRLTAVSSGAESPTLRKINRIRTIQGSLAIEGNTLSREQVTAIIDGQRVMAPPREILEVRNAITVYDKFQDWRVEEESELLEAHRILMNGLIEDVGVYRSGGVGVISGEKVIHVAPPAKRVPALVKDLFGWLVRSQDHPLIVSSVFHYEFEFIHPFTDGNGRIGRLWQSLILHQWNTIFAHAPVESLVHAHQDEYYQALKDSTQQTDSAPFIEFMLRMILGAITSFLSTDQVSDQVSDQVARLLQAIHTREMSGADLLKALGLTHRSTFRKNYLNPAIKGGWVERTQPESPRSPTQRYRLTEKGLILCEHNRRR